MSGHLFRSQASALFHAVCGWMDPGTFSKSAGPVSGTAREAGAAPRLDADHYRGAGDRDRSFLRGGSSGLPGNGKFSGGCTGNISECDR